MIFISKKYIIILQKNLYAYIYIYTHKNYNRLKNMKNVLLNFYSKRVSYNMINYLFWRKLNVS